jgi:predicted ArsR family transcriptional regulator
MAVQTTRQRIQEYLTTRKAATVKEISRALNLSAANVRYHLSVLSDQERVELIGHRPEQSPGRPRGIYGLSNKVQGDNLDILSKTLLKQYLGKLNDEQKDAEIRKLGLKIGSKTNLSNLNLNQRLFETVIRLNQLNYQARWEAHAEAPQMLLGRCPYWAIIQEHPELCTMDKYILESLLDRQVSQSAKLERDNQGVKRCIFNLQRR